MVLLLLLLLFGVEAVDRAVVVVTVVDVVVLF
jgi:hypothetical protein